MNRRILFVNHTGELGGAELTLLPIAHRYRDRCTVVLLKDGPLALSLAITHHRAPGAAWGQYVVFSLLTGARIAAPSSPATPSLARGERGPN